MTEKGLYQDVLILDKVPNPLDTTTLRSLRQKSAKQGVLLADVVSCSTSVNGLERAIKFFCRDRVIAETMDKAIILSNNELTRVITIDGTELNNGVMTGGYMPQLEAKNLGAGKVDASIKNLTKEVHDLDHDVRNNSQKIDEKERELAVLLEQRVSIDTAIQLLENKQQIEKVKNSNETLESLSDDIERRERELDEVRKIRE